MNKFTILGCGSSLGSPWITNYSARLKKKSKNIRTRCCAHIQKGNLSVLIDTSPDIKSQFLNNKIRSLDAIIYTHEHADQTSGIFEMRPFFWKNKKKIPVYASSRTIKELKDKYTFCFSQRHGYKPIMKANIIKKSFFIKKAFCFSRIACICWYSIFTPYLKYFNSLSVKVSSKSTSCNYVDLFCLSESLVFLIMLRISDQSSSDILESCEKVPPPDRY